MAARTSGENEDQSGISLFLVDPDSKGTDRKRIQMVDSRNACEISFKDVEVEEKNLLGDLGAGFPLIEEVLERAQIGISAEMLGNALEAFDRTLEYLKERKQFGAVIGSFQALQHRAAIMFAEVELTKSSVMGALNAIDELSLIHI